MKIGNYSKNAGMKRKAVSFKGFASSSEAASRCKSANRKTDCQHELVLRRELTKLGLRFRKHSKGLIGNPDVVFVPAKVIVFCDGDFWHGRNWRRLRRALAKRHNADYWIAKIKRNRAHDRKVTRMLLSDGWLVLRFWETDILKDPELSAKTIQAAVATRRIAMD